MSELAAKIDNVSELLNQVLSTLNGINDTNLLHNLSLAKKLMENVNNMKQELKSRYSSSELMVFDPGLTEIAKQISDKFDNIIEYKARELEIITKKLKMIQNRKKLLNYSRC